MAVARETIHSGHFMASNVHENRPEEEEEEIDVVAYARQKLAVPEVTPDPKFEKPVTFYKFGPQTTRSIAIDTSLLKLNKCIQTAYAQLITPKWKNFKGMKLAWQDRIRLNNVIWRAWHAQFVRNTQPKFCFFSVPEDDWHKGSEAAGVMEGIYWKRRMETVSAQYKRWRHFFYKRTSKCGFGERRVRSTSMRHSNSDEDALLLPLPSLTPFSGLDDDDWNNWFTDTLFSSLGQPYLFPNPKEMAQAGNADFIQPGLIQLQPSLEEIMASLENDGPLCGPSDPALNIALPSSELDRMASHSSADDPMLEALRNSANHYTSKDYAAASLLVEYSNSLTDQGSSSQSACSSAGFGNHFMRNTSSTSLSQRGDFTALGQSSNCDNQMYGSCSPRESGTGTALCDPYEPQLAKLATAETVGSQQMQYTLAKTWFGGDGNQTAASAPGYDFSPNGGAPGSSGNYSQMATTIQLLKSNPYGPRQSGDRHSREREVGTYPSDDVFSPSVTPKRSRKNSRSQADGKQHRRKYVDVRVNSADEAMRNQLSVASTAPTVVGIIGTGVGERNHPFARTPPATTQKKNHVNRSSAGRRGSSGVISVPSPERRSSLSSLETKHQGYSTMQPDYLGAPMGELPAAKPIDGTPHGMELTQSSSNYCNMTPLVIQPAHQQIGVVRPIPISLSTRNDSAFSALSPSGFSPPANMAHSPLQQRSPGSSTVSSIDYSKGLICTNDGNAPTTLMNMGQQTQIIYGGHSNAVGQIQPSTQAPLLILQPFGGMQFPIMALPYSNTGASFATPKQEPDKLPCSYDSEGYSSAVVDVSVKNASQRGVAQQQRSQARTNTKPQESGVQSKRAAKRPADSTLDPSERKRVQHLHAEQTRRSALKGGFELLEDLLPEFNSTNTKPTNALVLLKSAERLRELKAALPNNDMVILRLKAEIQQMNDRIGNYQKQLTISGKSASKGGMFQQMLDGYIKQRTQQSWRFWLIKKLLEPLLETYKVEVQGAGRDELLNTAIQWARKHCTKEELRPVVNGLLVQLGVETPLLTDPSSFRQYVQEQINK